MHHVSLLFGYMIPSALLTALCNSITYSTRTACAQDLGNYVTHKVTWYSTSAMASNVCTMLETQVSTELNRYGRKILVVKGTVHTRLRLKEIRAKVTVIDLASFDVGRLKKIS